MRKHFWKTCLLHYCLDFEQAVSSGFEDLEKREELDLHLSKKTTRGSSISREGLAVDSECQEVHIS